MARRDSPGARNEKRAGPATVAAESAIAPISTGFWGRTRLILAVVLLLSVHTALAVRSLIGENPTVDEVIHLPAGVTYWQTGSFRLYHHNPPLVKLIAALPVVASSPAVDYRSQFWLQEPPNKMVFAHEFMQQNAARYFELFTRARLLMPLFSIVGGLVVFFWSRSLYGAAGGLLSLWLWVFCPNILAHARLVTTDMGATALGVLATYVFWLFMKKPSWRLAALAGFCLGLAQLTKFSLLILYGLWPIFLVLQMGVDADRRKNLARLGAQLTLILLMSIVVIDAGYGFEGVGIPIGNYEFACQTLTRPAPEGMRRPGSPDPLLNGAYRYRVNRFRGGLLSAIPTPLPKHYLLGFDDQKLEAEGIPSKFLLPPGQDPGALGDEIQGYPVYLDGELRQKSWWYYYLLTLVYKVPEGTWLLVAGSLGVLAFSKKARATAFDEFVVLTMPVFVLFVMSLFTNINLGLRYVLPIFPFVFISAGKLAPWASGFAARGLRNAAWGFVILGMSTTSLATASIHPHYLAYFNALSGGPGYGETHLIDSNIDWGQDLVNLRGWLAENAPGERVGLAYFGQVNPRVFDARGEGFDWFLPPPRPGTMSKDNLPPRYQLLEKVPPPVPGLYAVSKTLVKGLPWRVYDSMWNGFGQGWLPRSAWFHAFSYFGEFKPIAQVGHSILIYRISPEDAAQIALRWEERVKGR